MLPGCTSMTLTAVKSDPIDSGFSLLASNKRTASGKINPELAKLPPGKINVVTCLLLITEYKTKSKEFLRKYDNVIVLNFFYLLSFIGAFYERV
ncbi:hypothetical protein TNCT_197191 [Trichonephila clavata]|uniref:Uncharacterized protein n=1 Tax=Trichonephila clavata TaxID=2740835 RepID=A0A8X6GU58_TRICU|nr:hypothetical protein TNCT_197191 [Trichonephila clavata]